MKISVYWLQVTLAALICANTAASAQKRIPPSESAQQWLDSLTAETASTAAATPAATPAIGRDPAGPTGQGSLAQAPIRDWRSMAMSKRSKWSNLRNQISRVAVGVSHAAQSAGYLPPATNRWLPMSTQNLQTSSAPGWPTTATQNDSIWSERRPTFAASDYSRQERALPLAANSPVAFQHFQSGIVSLDLPPGWRAMPSLGENMSFVSLRGESFNLGKVDVFCDQASMRNAVQFAGGNRVAIAYMQRMVAPPLSPEQIVARLLPQISGGAMHNVIIRGSQRMAYGGTAVAYDYTLLPQADALSRASLPPVLQRTGQVRMRGEIRITMLQGIPVGVVRTWSFLYSGVSAPQPVFSANSPVYARMFQSIQVNNAAAPQIMTAQQQGVNSAIFAMKSNEQQVQDFTRTYRRDSEQQLEQMTERNRRMDDLWIDMAGQQTRVKDPNDPTWGGYVQWGGQPGNSRPVHCWLQSSDPVFVDNTKPTPNGCNDVVPDYR